VLRTLQKKPGEEMSLNFKSGFDESKKLLVTDDDVGGRR
jgi:hypothetical protein